MKPDRLGFPARQAAALAGVLLMALQGFSPALAGPREQARRLHDRLAGVPPTDVVLTQMAADIQGGNTDAAAQVAMANKNFYNVTLKNFVAPWTNRDRTVFVPLNDYTATVIGMVRDDVDFSTLLSADLLYVANGTGAPAYSASDNNHYQYLDDNNVDLQAALQPATQSGLLGLPVAATAGIMTTRAASAAFFINGTNRAMFRFTLINHLCRDMEQVQDSSLPPDRIRQDVSRSPGGDSRVFLNSCITCHAGMDPMAQAFAYYNFDAASGRLQYTAGAVQPKYAINTDNFKYGYVTTDDHWDNYWRAGSNQVLGFDATLSGSGSGAKTMGQELAHSDGFAQCQVEKVFKAVCLRDPGDAADRQAVDTIKTKFKTTGYKMKQVFADAAVYCMGS
ncbi:MAG TPA: hypothetical protein VK130_01555 [Steroidobacteraceae bacterium]|nr:hypothetical protein [Steroidobacteraceae bacterium]